MGILTDQIQFTGTPANNDVIHMVDVSDPTDNPGGTSFKVTLSTLNSYFSSTSSTPLYWTSGSTGNYSLKVINDSSVDATADYALAEGQDTLATAQASHAEGRDTRATGTYSHAEGWGNTASGSASHAEGGDTGEGFQGTSATTESAHAEGFGTLASGTASHAEGQNTTASGSGSHAEGINTESTGSGSHAEGNGTLASGINSHAEGQNTTASGNRSHAEGRNTTASGIYSHAGGDGSVSSGDTSFIHSTNSLVTGDRSVVLGGQGITGTSSDTVYVPFLNIKNLGTTTPFFNIGVDVNGTVVSANTGIVSGSCVSDFYVSNIHSCSPLRINPFDEGDVFVGGSDRFSIINTFTGGTKVGINKPDPGYALQLGTGDVFVTEGTMAIGGSSPDPQHRVRITVSETPLTVGVQTEMPTTALRLDMSYQDTTPNPYDAPFGQNTINGMQIRSTTTGKGFSGITYMYGMNSNLTGNATNGTNYYYGGRFRAATSNGGATNVINTGLVVEALNGDTNYALQLRDGSEGTAGHVWASIDTTGIGGWVHPNSIISGATGSFTAGSGEVVTVVNGIITSIV
jgi:hypothetical protein